MHRPLFFTSNTLSSSTPFLTTINLVITAIVYDPSSVLFFVITVTYKQYFFTAEPRLPAHRVGPAPRGEDTENFNLFAHRGNGDEQKNTSLCSLRALW